MNAQQKQDGIIAAIITVLAPKLLELGVEGIEALIEKLHHKKDEVHTNGGGECIAPKVWNPIAKQCQDPIG
jgi:hypothetical protein